MAQPARPPPFRRIRSGAAAVTVSSRKLMLHRSSANL
jgi:hypothetical protein